MDVYKSKAIIIGMDIGKKVDHSAIAVVELKQKFKENIKPYQLNLEHGKLVPTEEIHHHIHAMKRLPLGTDYMEQVKAVEKIYYNIKNNRKTHALQLHLVVDETGVGGSMYDFFRASHLKPIGINITGGGGRVNRFSNTSFGVPKVDLATTIERLLQTGQIKIADSISLKNLLIHELQNWQVKITEHGNEQFTHRSGEHDDMIIAIALACWFGERQIKKKIRSFPKKSLGLK